MAERLTALTAQELHDNVEGWTGGEIDVVILAPDHVDVMWEGKRFASLQLVDPYAEGTDRFWQLSTLANPLDSTIPLNALLAVMAGAS